MNNSGKLGILVVDDTIVYRKIVTEIASEIPGVEVVGSASNGKIAVSRIKTHKPDLLILDVEMPELNGIDVLQYIKDNELNVGAIMLSGLTYAGSKQTVKALELGAFDFIPKPKTNSVSQSKKQIKEDLVRVVNAFYRDFEFKNKTMKQPSQQSDIKPVSGIYENRRPSTIIAIGISTGGPNALQEMLPGLPKDLGVPVIIVQHMPPMFTKSLAESLDRKCDMTVMEAYDGQIIEPNVILIAPGGTQMKVAMGAGGKKIIKITDDPSENGCKPSVDYLFRSVADLYGSRATSVIMTGMGCDGKSGMRKMKEAGALTIAQDKQSCVVYGMPKAVAEDGIVDIVAPLESIAKEICNTVKNNMEVLV